MPSSPPLPSFLHRLRTWLSAKGGLRLELLKYLAGIAAATTLLAALLLLALHRAFFDANETHGLNAWAICKLALYLLTGAGSIGGLFFCLWNALRIYSGYLQSVEKAEARSRFVIEACPDAILMVDSQGNIESFNPSTEAIFGFNRTQLLGAKISKLIPQRHFLLDVAAMGRENFMAFAERQNSVRFPVEIAVSEARSAYTGSRRPLNERYAQLRSSNSDTRIATEEAKYRANPTLPATTPLEQYAKDVADWENSGGAARKAAAEAPARRSGGPQVRHVERGEQ